MFKCWTVLSSSKLSKIGAGSSLGGCAGDGTCLVVNGRYFGWGGKPRSGGRVEGLVVGLVVVYNL